MKKYKCHKIVAAAAIRSIYPYFTDIERQILILDDGAAHNVAYDVSVEWVKAHKVSANGYLVRYDNGYESFSPAAEFEAGYTPWSETGEYAEQAGAKRIERKYSVSIQEPAIPPELLSVIRRALNSAITYVDHYAESARTSARAVKEDCEGALSALNTFTQPPTSNDPFDYAIVQTDNWGDWRAHPTQAGTMWTSVKLADAAIVRHGSDEIHSEELEGAGEVWVRNVKTPKPYDGAAGDKETIRYGIKWRASTPDDRCGICWICDNPPPGPVPAKAYSDPKTNTWRLPID